MVVFHVLVRHQLWQVGGLAANSRAEGHPIKARLSRNLASVHGRREFIRVERMPFQRVLDLVLAGEIMDGMTIIAVLRAARMREV